MIDDIVEMILKEARGRKVGKPACKVYNVMQEIEARIISVMDKFREEERRIKVDENKGR